MKTFGLLLLVFHLFANICQGLRTGETTARGLPSDVVLAPAAARSVRQERRRGGRGGAAGRVGRPLADVVLLSSKGTVVVPSNPPMAQWDNLLTKIIANLKEEEGGDKATVTASIRGHLDRLIHYDRLGEPTTGTSVSAKYFSGTPYPLPYHGTEHAIEAALHMFQYAVQLDLPNIDREIFFVAGLYHDLGYVKSIKTRKDGTEKKMHDYFRGQRMGPPNPVGIKGQEGYDKDKFDPDKWAPKFGKDHETYSIEFARKLLRGQEQVMDALMFEKLVSIIAHTDPSWWEGPFVKKWEKAVERAKHICNLAYPIANTDNGATEAETATIDACVGRVKQKVFLDKYGKDPAEFGDYGYFMMPGAPCRVLGLMREIVQNDFLLQDFIFFLGKSSKNDATADQIRRAELVAVKDFIEIQADFVEKKANELFYDRTRISSKFGMTTAQKANVDKNAADFRLIFAHVNDHKPAILAFVGLDATGAKVPPSTSLTLTSVTPHLTCNAVQTGPFKGMSSRVHRSLTDMVNLWNTERQGELAVELAVEQD